MNIDPEAKMFSKGKEQAVDADGCPKMEKVSLWISETGAPLTQISFLFAFSTLFGKRLIALLMARLVAHC